MPASSHASLCSSLPAPGAVRKSIVRMLMVCREPGHLRIPAQDGVEALLNHGARLLSAAREQLMLTGKGLQHHFRVWRDASYRKQDHAFLTVGGDLLQGACSLKAPAHGLVRCARR